MVDITHKSSQLRKAIASARINLSSQEVIDIVLAKRVPKGDVFEFSRAAGLLAIKKTSDVIPDCHPLPVEYAAIRHDIQGLSIIVTVEVHTIYKTGVEVEAMHGASITALTIYDMLKPLDKQIEIASIKLENKIGGKSSHGVPDTSQLSAAVVVCSDSVSAGDKTDRSGKIIIEKLLQHGLTEPAYLVVADDEEIIRDSCTRFKEDGKHLIILTGGTGLSDRDVTPEAIRPLIDREIPGIMEVTRQYGQQRTPFAMLSRGVAGFSGDTLIITLPGSAAGVTESMDALFPHLLHVFKLQHGG